MHRVLGSLDVCITTEMHVMDSPPSIGVSEGTLKWMPPWSKSADTVEMGSLAVHPLGIGHDTGIMRPHVMIAAPPAPPVCAAASAKATAMSSCKPQFSAHLSQAGVGSECLPVTAEPIPYGVGILVGTVCGSPMNIPAPIQVPLIPTQWSVWTGMTAGDIVGGIVNVAVDVTLSAALGALGNGLKSKILKKLLEALPILSIVGKFTGYNLDTGIDNPGSVVQKAIDRDGVSSSAKPGGRVGGFGVSGDSPVGPWNA